MKKPYIKKTVKDVPIYGGPLLIIFTNSDTLLNKYDKTHKVGDNIYGCFNLINYKGYNGYMIVLNFDYPGELVTHGFVAHEALHATNCILHQKGIKEDYKNDEAQAYLLDWITDQIYLAMKKHGFKIK